MIYIAIAILLFVLQVVYFRVADRLNIVDMPTARSSHTRRTYRGSGILFPVAAVLWFFLFGRQMPLAIAGMVIIGGVSFADDISPIRAGIRILFHLLAVCLLFLELDIFNMYWYWIAAAFILTVGCVNAVNFMDGINGITALYSLVALGTFSLLNNAEVLLQPFLPAGLPVGWESFVPPRLVGVLFISIAVFAFFNVRRHAIAFAGDVGSLSIGFVLSWLMIELMVMSNDFHWILLFAVYGIDAGYTIARRLSHGENIFRPHRQHLYQLLANEYGWPHLKVSGTFALVQLLVNGGTVLLIMTGRMTTPLFLGILAALSLVYTAIRRSLSLSPSVSSPGKSA